MPSKSPVVLQSRSLKVEIDPRDLAAHVTVKATGETLRMAPAQPDDVMMVGKAGAAWKSFADSPVTIRKVKANAVQARLPGLGLAVRIEVDAADVVFEIAPAGKTGRAAPREVLYPRHFILPKRGTAYATFPLSQGSIIPGNWPVRFHHREGYAEAVAHWVGGYTGKTGYCAVAETPDDLYQAVDHRPGQAASCFFHWLGTLGRLGYPRRARYHFAKGLGYVRQAKHYRAHCKRVGLFRSLADKAAENPNVKRLIGAPILPVSACHRRERTMEYAATKFTDLARAVERFRKRTGIRNAVVHVDGWGYWGYDAMHPDALPPNMECGGAAGLAELARRAKAVGYLFGLHDQYIDYYHHAPSFNERNSIVLEDGTPTRVNRWCGGLCGHLCYHLIPPFVKRNYFEGVRRTYPIYHNSPSIWEICQPTASYLDCFCRGGVECFSPDHPMTRTEGRQRHNETFQIVRNGADGQRVVLSVEHPRDYSAAYLDFGWSLGHLAIDVPTTAGGGTYTAEGIPVPLWHLVFHDAVAVPSPGDNLPEALLYAQAPYFHSTGTLSATELARKKVLLKLHQDAAFAEMTDHQLVSADGNVQKSVFDAGLTVEVNKKTGTYRISEGKAKARRWRKL